MSNTIWTKRFWSAAAERAIKATAWAASSSLLASGAGLIDADWVGCASVAGMAGVLSLLGSVASDAATGDGPSITKAEVIPPGAGDDDGRHRP
jgi:hypothetical protein